MRILVTGKNGLVGSAIREQKTNHDFVFIGRKEADLTNEDQVIKIYKEIKPDWVIHTAAKVGGVMGNLTGQAQYFHENLLMNTHIIHHAWKNDVKKLLVFSSACVFPDGIPVLREDLMHCGEPFVGNFAYAHAKRMVDIQIKAYKSQYGVTNYGSIIPGNIFGENDLYNLTHAHVIPALIHKIYLAKRDNKDLICWGDGSAKREFIYSRDLAKIILELIEKDIPERLIISGEKQLTIKEIVEKLCIAADFKGKIIWDTSKPNGQTARLSDLTLLKSLIDFKLTDLDEALKNSYWWFQNNWEIARK